MQAGKDDGFYLIWLYWVKKYMNDKIRPKDSIHQVIASLKKHYTLEALDSKSQLDQKLAAVKETKHKQQWPIYLIDPEHEIKLIERNLHEQYEEFRNEIYSYYLNIKNIFIIYRNDWQGSEKLSSKGDSLQRNDNISEGHRLYKSMIRPLQNKTEGNKSRIEVETSSIINRIFYSCLEYQSSQCHDGSMQETVQHKIEDLQILDKMFHHQEFQIWNCKYKNIPHSYLKIKDEVWNKCLSFPLMHPSQPKTIGEVTIIPQLELFEPGIDKLLPFISYIKLLDKYFPGYIPSKESIFQINDMPYVLSKDCQTNWSQQKNVGMLCYYVVHGDDDTLTPQKVQKWAEANPGTLLGKTIKDLSKRSRQKKKAKLENEKRPFSLFENQQEGNIW